MCSDDIPRGRGRPVLGIAIQSLRAGRYIGEIQHENNTVSGDETEVKKVETGVKVLSTWFDSFDDDKPGLPPTPIKGSLTNAILEEAGKPLPTDYEKPGLPPTPVKASPTTNAKPPDFLRLGKRTYLLMRPAEFVTCLLIGVLGIVVFVICAIWMWGADVVLK